MWKEISLNGVVSYGTAKSLGRPSIPSGRQIRSIQHKASNSTSSVKKINFELDAGASGSTLLGRFHGNSIFVHKKMKHTSIPTEKLKNARFSFVLEFILWYVERM